MTKFKKYVIKKLIQQRQNVNPMYPLGVAITGCLLFILYDNDKYRLDGSHYSIYCYDLKTNSLFSKISLNLLDAEDGILNLPAINFTSVNEYHSYYTFDGMVLIKHTIL